MVKRGIVFATALVLLTGGLVSGCATQSPPSVDRSVARVDVTSAAITTYNSEHQRLGAEKFTATPAEFLGFLTKVFGSPKQHHSQDYVWGGMTYSSGPNEVDFSEAAVNGVSVFGEGTYQVGKTFPLVGSRKACYPGSMRLLNTLSASNGQSVTIVSAISDANLVGYLVAPSFNDAC
jgi:hypothetical protein